MKRISLLIIGICFLASPVFADDLSGKYHGNQLSIDLTAAGDGHYDGTIHLGAQDFPCTAIAQANHIDGTFTANGHGFTFAADLNGDAMTLQSGGATYQLTRDTPPANPLAAAQPANPLVQPAAPAANANPAPFNDFQVLATTDSGKTLFIQKPQATSAQSAIQSTLPDLAKLFGSRPKPLNAFADSQQPTRGGATFSASKDSKEIHGTILCGAADRGEVVTVVYANADAPATDLATLNAALPMQSKMETHAFPDDTGSIDLPSGWTTPNETVLGGVVVNGPADQIVTLGRGIEVVTPNSPIVQMQQQAEANARAWGMAPPPRMRVFVAPFTGPADALKNLVPQISEFSQMANGPALSLDQIIDSHPAPANLPNGQAALVQYLIIKGDQKFHCIAQIETYPLGPQGWGVFFSELAAPAATFDHDAPTMWAIARSFKTNDAVIAQKTQQQIQANNQRFAAFEQSMKEKQDSFDSYMQSVKNRELVNSRTNADFDEVIRGYRTVEDTSTGEHTSVDLGKVDDVVNKLNEADPGRYKQIPLRDEEYPVPGN
jgi:hypothetical protein